MKEYKIGFIGCGNMAKAMIGGLASSNCIESTNIYASNPSVENLKYAKNNFGVNVTVKNIDIAIECDIIFLSTKPNLYSRVIDEIKDYIDMEKIVIMIAAGQTLAVNEAKFKKEVKLIRAMPNTPSLVGEGMSAIACNKNITEEDQKLIHKIFLCFGRVEFINEKLMDVVTGISGSSPAYVYLFIESLADAAVSNGMPRKQAYAIAAQAVLGAAKMVLETNKHPGQLKDDVCSPGGTTIAAVTSLEKNRFRSTTIEAVNVAIEKSKNMR